MIAGLALGGMLMIAFGGWFLFRGNGTDSANNSARETASKAATAWLESNSSKPNPQSPKEMAISAKSTESNDDTESQSVPFHENRTNEQVITQSDEDKKVGSEQKTKRSAEPVAETKSVEQSTTNSKLNIKTKKNNSDKKSQGFPLPSITMQDAQRSRSAVMKLISSVGRTPPDWFDATPLDYPKTLDLSWPKGKPKGGWNNQKNVGQFIWDITTVRLEVE